MIRLGIVTNGTLGLIYASHARRRPAKSLENNGAVQHFLSDVIKRYAILLDSGFLKYRFVLFPILS